jgi:hypothetical protein
VAGRQPISKERQSESSSRLGACRVREQWQAGSKERQSESSIRLGASRGRESGSKKQSVSKTAHICSSTEVISREAGEVTKLWQNAGAGSQAAKLGVGQGQPVCQQVGRQVAGTGSMPGQPVC